MNKRDLAKFKRELLKKRAEILSTIDKNLKTGAEISFVTGRSDDVDKASNELEHSLIYQLSERESTYLKKIDRKLQEIEDNTYNICKKCGKEIGLERLTVRPVADLCIDCKVMEEAREEAELK